MDRAELMQVAQRIAAPALADEPDGRRDLFGLRLQRWWADLCDPLEELYGKAAAAALIPRLVTLAADTFHERDPELARLDIARGLEPDWFQKPDLVGYAAYTERFAGDLASVAGRIPYLRELGVGYLHLMPLLGTRAGDNDGGYAVVDYRAIRADLGTFDDLRTLTAQLRKSGISLVLDLVLNHVAREHEWAVAAQAGSQQHRDYFYVFGDRTEPDAFEQTLPEIFPEFAPGNFSWDDALPGWVWTTFNSWQWDVNWSNPQVFFEFADIVCFLANAGVEVLRLDAVAFLWKRLGTNCQNQPEVHAIAQALRALARIACPAVVFKAEAIVGPSELVPYLGQGRRHGKVSDLAYHNSLMVQIWSMLATADVALATQALRALPVIPSTTAWITYVRCHDDIGWAISDEDAVAVGLDGNAHRAFLADYFVGDFPDSPARGLTFQHNPVNGDRRISGTAASLTGVESAREAGDAAAEAVAIDRLLLAYTIVYGWGGVPVIWSGDELALLNDAAWASEIGHENDNRWAHRPRLRPESIVAHDDRAATEGHVFRALGNLARIRAGLPHLHASVAAEVLDPADPCVLTVVRRHPIGNLVQLYNVSSTWRPWPVHILPTHGLSDAEDVLHARPIVTDADGNIWLAPYSAMWLVSPQ